MNKVASAQWFAILGALAVSGSACTVTVNGGDGDAGLGPVDQSDAALDTGTTPETSAAAETATPEASATADGNDGGNCAILQQRSLSFGSPACDMCLGGSCCSEATACFPNPQSECESAFTCFGDCLVGNPDAGIAPGSNASCKSDCGGVDGGLPTFNSLVDCVVSNCSTECL